MKKIEIFKVEGDRINRVRRHCPKCGAGVFLAEHKNRISCGKCGYTEFKVSSKKEPEPPKVEEKPEEQKVEEPKEEPAPEPEAVPEPPVEEPPKDEPVPESPAEPEKPAEEPPKKEETTDPKQTKENKK